MTEGVTSSERYLAKLCKHSFLSLWSWPNVFRDQRNAPGIPGKEVCDLLVIFGNHIIVFSDKYCAFPDTGNLVTDWCRWFKKAIWKSAQQTWGAERWIREYPERLFLDGNCSVPFPIRIPETEHAVFHRVVVAHGSGDRAASVLGGSGSLVVAPTVEGRQHFDSKDPNLQPFFVGRIDSTKGFVHVIDDFSLDVLLRTLNTAPDFIRYLECKEAFIESGKLAFAAGEEELLAYYLKNVDETGQHDFVHPADVDHVVIEEGHWKHFRNHPDRRSQIQADRIGYAWDRLIEWFTKHVVDGTIETQTPAPLSEYEAGLRLMATENRTVRRMLASAFLSNLERGEPRDTAARIVEPVVGGDRFYVFLRFSPRRDRSYREYQEVRRELLISYCHVVRHKYPRARDIIGIASDPPTPDGGSSEDLVYLDGRKWNEELDNEARELSQKLDILTHPRRKDVRVSEYPTEQTKEMRKGRNRNKPCPCGSGKKYKKCCGNAGS